MKLTDRRQAGKRKEQLSYAKNLVKDAASIVNSTAREAAAAVADTAMDMLDSAMDRSEDDEEEEDITEDGGLDYAAGATEGFKEEPEQAADTEDKEADSEEVEEIYEGTGDALKKFAAEESTTIVEDTADEP